MADILGYAASAAVLASFLMRTMVPLRLVAILSNVLFVAFGYVQSIHPILFLHMVLLPINSWRLLAALEGAKVQGQWRTAQHVMSAASRTYAVWLVLGLLATASLLAYMMVENSHHV